MIPRGSRYQGLEVGLITFEDGDSRPLIFRRTPVTEADIGDDFLIHEVIEGERLDQICAKYEIPETKWWIISDLNPETVEVPWELNKGDQIIVPTARGVAKVS